MRGFHPSAVPLQRCISVLPIPTAYGLWLTFIYRNAETLAVVGLYQQDLSVLCRTSSAVRLASLTYFVRLHYPVLLPCLRTYCVPLLYLYYSIDLVVCQYFFKKIFYFFRGGSAWVTTSTNSRSRNNPYMG